MRRAREGEGEVGEAVDALAWVCAWCRRGEKGRRNGPVASNFILRSLKRESGNSR